MKILIVDDLPSNRRLIELHAAMLGHGTLSAADGDEALALYRDQLPDMVIMDINMPGRSGIEVTREMRALPGRHWTPILFVSAYAHHDNVLRALDAGGDDFLPKPVDVALLGAKIRAMQRVVEFQRELEERNAELAALRNAWEEEQEVARNLLAHMVRSPITVEGLEIWQQPSSAFNGDLTIATCGAGGELFLLHADSMGHGLAAALPLLPITQVFRELSGLGYSTAGLARAMNRQLRHQIPPGRFVALVLARVDRHNQTVEVWNGGCPSVLMLDDEGRLLHEFVSHATPLGILDDDRFDATVESYRWQTACRLVMHSDGVTDALSPAGEAFGVSRLRACLTDPALGLGLLRSELERHLHADRGQDDMSVLTMRCGMEDAALCPGVYRSAANLNPVQA
jgi:CheY-like chemotaxis protein